MESKDLDLMLYIQQSAQLIHLNIPPEYLPNVVENFRRILEISTLVTEFSLPEDIQPSPTFEP